MCHERLGGYVTGQVRARIVGPLDERVPGVTVGGDSREHHLAVLVLLDTRFQQRRGAAGDRIAERLACRRDADGQVDDAIAVRGNVAGQLGSLANRTTQYKPRRAGLEHIVRLVAAPGLRTAICHDRHAEGGGVVMRRLPGVADREDDGIHASHGELVARAVADGYWADGPWADGYWADGCWGPVCVVMVWLLAGGESAGWSLSRQH